MILSMMLYFRRAWVGKKRVKDGRMPRCDGVTDIKKANFIYNFPFIGLKR